MNPTTFSIGDFVAAYHEGGVVCGLLTSLSVADLRAEIDLGLTKVWVNLVDNRGPLKHVINPDIATAMDLPLIRDALLVFGKEVDYESSPELFDQWMRAADIIRAINNWNDSDG